MSKTAATRRIPFLAAAHRLKRRLDASSGEIALWVAGFVSGTTLTAFKSELDDAPPFNFEAETFITDPDWLDYCKRLAGCYFDEQQVEAVAPAERFVDMQDAIARVHEVAGGRPDDAAGFIRSRIENDGLDCRHPVVGIPDLADKAEFDGALVSRQGLEDAILAYFGSAHGSAANTAQTGQALNLRTPHVWWRKILYERMDEIDAQHEGHADVYRVLSWLREHGGDRILDQGGPHALVWIDDYGETRRTPRVSVMNAISAARRQRRTHR